MKDFETVGFIPVRQAELRAFLMVHDRERYLTEEEFAEFGIWLDAKTESERRAFIRSIDPAADKMLERMGAIFIDSPADDRASMKSLFVTPKSCEPCPEAPDLVVSEYVAYWK